MNQKLDDERRQQGDEYLLLANLHGCHGKRKQINTFRKLTRDWSLLESFLFGLGRRKSND